VRGWDARRGGAAQPVHSRVSTPAARSARRAGGHRLGVGRVCLADSPARPAERRPRLCSLRATDAVPVLAVRGRLPGRCAPAFPEPTNRSGRRGHTRAAARPAATAATPASSRDTSRNGREVRRMVYAIGLTAPTPRVDSTASCADLRRHRGLGRSARLAAHGRLLRLPLARYGTATRGHGRTARGTAVTRAELELEYQRHLALCEQANENRQRLARITEQVAA
jgi:hypothetical protein